MSDVELGESLNGGQNAGFYGDLRGELSGLGAEALIERCKSNPKLRPNLVGFPQYMADNGLREELAMYVLTHDGVWEFEWASRSFHDFQEANRAANAFVATFLDGEFWGEPPPDSSWPAKLQYTLVSREGRRAVAEVYRQLISLSESERVAGSAGMASVHQGLIQAFDKFGTYEFAKESRMGNKGRRPRPEADRAALEGERLRGNSVDQQATSGGGGRLPWGVVAVIVALAVLVPLVALKIRKGK